MNVQQELVPSDKKDLTLEQIIDIMMLDFKPPLSLEEIGEGIGRTAERFREIENENKKGKSV